ncbi:MAG: response regulator transcription factor ['Candidatus Kapabacteria' thiocyanatum]|uniref:DNA-binding response regulator n=1 Tax=Candidatus Kapaibacterium thiocyanatum TaxID=1895771 RepID=A0A1M3KXJ1_9BACT|nr:response regulator transcription factor ['Candidatus Kapabacteria' thiocyanatum]OJX57107.1 MAG: hypothetical protein BGO89_11420 ['Candidatus Kapabacteria' thiocyanatum]
MTTSNPIRVYMVDDHRSVLEGIKAALLLTSDIHIVGSATDSVAALEEIGQRRNEIDIVLSDVGMPVMDGIELCRKLKSGGTLPYVILLTQYSEAEVRFRAVRADADGYVLKVAGIDEILACLRNVMNGSFAQFERSYYQPTISNRRLGLTETELKILKMIVYDELTSREIAEQLFRSIHTIEQHRKAIMAKLGINSTIGLVKYAYAIGLYNPDSENI